MPHSIRVLLPTVKVLLLLGLLLLKPVLRSVHPIVVLICAISCRSGPRVSMARIHSATGALADSEVTVLFERTVARLRQIAVTAALGLMIAFLAHSRRRVLSHVAWHLTSSLASRCRPETTTHRRRASLEVGAPTCRRRPPISTHPKHMVAIASFGA